MEVRKVRIDIQLDAKSLFDSFTEFERLVIKMSPEVTQGVAQDVDTLIKASGRVPYKTGRLQNSSRVFRDKYTDDGYLIGWFTPYAKTRYYGKGAKKQWYTKPQGTRGRKLAYRTGSQPYWDRQFTRNNALMMALYKKHLAKTKWLRK